MSRINLRISDDLKAGWEDAVDRLGYPSLSNMIITLVNSGLSNADPENKVVQTYANNKSIKEMDKEIRAILSEGYFPQRIIGDIRKMINQGSFIDHEYFIKYIDAIIEKCLLQKDPIAVLRSILPELRAQNLKYGVRAVSRKLLELGVSHDKLQEYYFHKNSIKNKTREKRNGKTDVT